LTRLRLASARRADLDWERRRGGNFCRLDFRPDAGRRAAGGAPGAEPCLAQVDDLIVIAVCSTIDLWNMQEIFSEKEGLTAAPKFFGAGERSAASRNRK